MEEKILIKSEKYDVKKIFTIFMIIGLIVSVIMVISNLATVMSREIDNYKNHQHSLDCIKYGYHENVQNRIEAYNDLNNTNLTDSEFINEHLFSKEENLSMLSDICPTVSKSATSYAIKIWWNNFSESGYCAICLIPVVGLTVIGALISLLLSIYKITVTDKRVSGEVIFGKKVNLPIASISATSNTPLFKHIGVSTPSGRISVFAIKNAQDIYDVINNILIERQQKMDNAIATVTTSKSNKAE